MASPSEKLADGIDKVCEVRSAALPNENLADEAWAAVKTGIVVARRDTQALDDQPKEKMAQVLHFLVQKGMKKKSARGQISECLRILLARPGWLCTAQEDADLCSSLREAFSGSKEVLALLDESPPAAQEESASAATCTGKTKPAGIPEQLSHGFHVMQSFAWEFPRDPLGTKIDEATDGFMHFFDAITLLTTTGGKASIGGDIAAALCVFEEHWGGILRFFLSMYNCGFRGSYKGRIRFVVVTLRSFSPAFRSQLPWQELPWGSDPMPAEEAAAEAARKTAEEEARRNLEQQDYELAFEMQTSEHAERDAEEQMRKKITSDDRHFARDLQDKELARLPPARRTAFALG